MISVVRSLHRLAQADADPGLGARIDGGGRVVEDQDPRVDRERARDRQPLALAAREPDPALADHRVVAVRQLLDEFVRLREPRDPLDLGVVEVGRAEGDVLPDGRGEQERILRDDADGVAERGRARRRERRRRRPARGRRSTS